jgi:hypothetical protein
LPHDLCLPARATRHALPAGLAVTFIRGTPLRLLWHTALSCAARPRVLCGTPSRHSPEPDAVTTPGPAPSQSTADCHQRYEGNTS